LKVSVYHSYSYSPLSIEEVSAPESQREETWKVDLSQNLGNILKPSNPDFGYEDYMSFNPDLASPKKKGWGLFLEFIQRYPVTQKAQNIFESIKKEKVLF